MRKLINYKLIFLSSFFLAACSNEDNIPSILPSNQPDAVELGITAGVTLTKSAVAANTGLTGGIAVYAALDGTASGTDVDPYTSTLKNNYAVYTLSGSWATATDATDKIYLTSQTAKIFAHYPAYSPIASGQDDAGALKTTGTALKATESSNKVSATSTINISVYPGKNTITTNNFLNPTTSNAEKTWGSGWTNNTTTNSNIISAPGEVDYMWGSTDGSNASTQPTTSNGKVAGSAHDGSVNIYMNHALALVSFRIYNDGTYKNTGKLTKIQLKNKNASGLSDGGAVNMNISTGAITTGSGAAGATYTRFIDNDGNGTPSGYTIISVATTPSATAATTENDAKAASSKFSIMALPIAAGDNVAANTVQAIFTIDGADYDVALGSSGNLTWERGKNHLYTVKLSGKGLSVGTVTVAAWGTGAGNDDLKVN